MTSVTYRPAGADDALAISILLSGAFDGPTEGLLVKRLRSEHNFALEMVAVEDGHVIGYAGFPLLKAPADWVALSPVAVRGDRQHRGIGSELIRYGLDKLRQAHYKAALVLGEPSYYGRFGFSVEAAANVESPYPAEFLGLYSFDPATAGASARAIYPDAFQEA